MPNLGFCIPVQVTGPLKDPEKRTPLGIPLVPLPVMVKVPPALKVAPPPSVPDSNELVVKVTEPSLPVYVVPPMLKLDRVELVRVTMEPLVVKVPPLFFKTIWVLLAQVAMGKPSASTANQRNFFMKFAPGIQGDCKSTGETVLSVTNVPS